MEKSFRIRVNLDVRKPLKKHVPIKLRGGELCQCPVKYEKLPLICFYCGKLGHGSNECKEAFGDSSPVKNYGTWLKASPWRPMKVTSNVEDREDGKASCRKLFFPKKQTPKEPQENSHEGIVSVTSLLDKVALDKGNSEKATNFCLIDLVGTTLGDSFSHLDGDNIQ